MRPIPFLQIAFLLLSILSLLASAGAPEPAYGEALASNRPAQEKNPPRNDAPKPGSPGSDGKQAEPKGKAAESDRRPGSENSPVASGKSGQPQSSTGGDRRVPTETARPQATATEHPKPSVIAISVSDPCGVTGSVRFVAPYSGTVTLRLTYHLTGEPEFTQTSSTWTSSLDGQTETDFLLPMLSPGLPEDQQPRLSAYRIEVAAANPPLTNMPVKSGGFRCADWEGAPEPLPTATQNPTGEVTATATSTSVQPSPSGTPAVPPTTTDSPTAAPSASATATVEPSPQATPTTEPSPQATPSATPSSVITPTPSATPTGTATPVPGIITLILSTPSISFGGVSPAGFQTFGEEDVFAAVDEMGAFYVKRRALQVTVSSNSAWQGAVRAAENLGSASSIRIADGDLQWRLADESGWSVLSASSTGFAEGSSGVSSFWYDYGLRVLWEDDPGSFSSVVSYSVTQ